MKGKCFDYKYENYLFEIDGSYWHALPNVVIKDKIKDELAERENFKLIRFTIDTALQAKESIKQNLPLLQSIFI